MIHYTVRPDVSPRCIHDPVGHETHLVVLPLFPILAGRDIVSEPLKRQFPPFAPLLLHPILQHFPHLITPFPSASLVLPDWLPRDFVTQIRHRVSTHSS